MSAYVSVRVCVCLFLFKLPFWGDDAETEWLGPGMLYLPAIGEGLLAR